MVCCLLSVSRQSSTRGIRQRTSTATIADVVIGLNYGVVVNQGETLAYNHTTSRSLDVVGTNAEIGTAVSSSQGEASRASPGHFGVKSAATAFNVRVQARGHCRCSRSDAANLAAGWVVDHFT